MKTVLGTIFLLIHFLACFGQVDTTKVPFISYWSKGDSYDFRITKIKQQWKEGVLTKNDSSAYVVNFLVIDSTESNYKIKWSYKTNLTEFNIPPELFDKFSEYEITDVIYQTSEVGELIGIENWEEISRMMNRLFTDLIDIYAKEKKISKHVLAKSMQSLISFYNSKQGIEQIVFKELQYFHFPFGLVYSISEPIIYEETLPSLLGGNSIRGDSKIYFEYVDFENFYCVFIQEMMLNPEDTKEMITAFINSMNLDDEEMKKAMNTAKFEIKDYNRYEYFYSPGIPYKIESNRQTLIDINKEKAKSIEITRIELIE